MNAQNAGKRNYNMDNTRIINAKRFCELKIKEFKQENPNLPDFNKILPKYPYGIKTPSSLRISQKIMGQTKMPPATLSFICGTIIGDSSISLQKGYANARIQFRHSTRQTDWFMFKIFGPFKPYVEDSSVQIQTPDGHQTEAAKLPGELLGKWKVATKVNPEITKLYRIIGPSDKPKRIRRFWLNHMNEWFLLAVWLDDGGLYNNNREGQISVQSFSIREADILAKYLTTVWGVNCKTAIYESRKSITNPQAPVIVFENLDAIEKFLEIVAPIIPVKSMLYKVFLCPKDSTRRQRWASKLKTLIRPEWHDEIDKYYAYYEVFMTGKD